MAKVSSIDLPKIYFRHRDISTKLKIEQIIDLIYPKDRDENKKKVVLYILNILYNNPRNGLTRKEVAKIQQNLRDKVSKATFYRLLKDLKRLGMIRFERSIGTYYLSTDFASALERLAKAYRKWISSMKNKREKG